MNYSIENAKTVLELIESVSPYSYPLLISLIFPLIWVLFKKLLGITNAKKIEPDEKPLNLVTKVKNILISLFTLKGDTADKTIFYTSISLFIASGILLKYGEYKEEVIRQRALSLKQLYLNDRFLYFKREWLNEQNYDEAVLDKILYRYPEVFLHSGENVICVDSLSRRKIITQNEVLLNQYLREQFKLKKEIYIDSLFQADGINNVKNFFSKDLVYRFLAANENSFDLDVKYDMTVIKKSEMAE